MVGVGKVFVMSLLFFLVVCSSMDFGIDSGIEVFEDIVLDEQLVEILGLYCDVNNIFIINDLGNSFDLFILNMIGMIVKSE